VVIPLTDYLSRVFSFRRYMLASAALFAAFSVACAIFLILELDHPFGGMIRIPNETMTNVLSQLAKSGPRDSGSRASRTG